MALPSTPPIHRAGNAVGSVVDREKKGLRLGEPDAARLPVDLYVRAPQRRMGRLTDQDRGLDITKENPAYWVPSMT
jgi:hypothetical protein